MATPVSAAWPTASEKKAKRLTTTRVPRPPSTGPISRPARSALTTKP